MGELKLFPVPEPEKAGRARDPIWDALSEVFGEPVTRTEQTLRGRIVSSLRHARVEPAEILIRVQAWPLHFPGATLTVTALEKHWTQLGRPPLRASESDIDAYQAEMRSLQRQRRAQELEAEKKGLPE